MEQAEKNQSSKQIASEGDHLEITVPGSWESDRSLNDKADLGAKYARGEKYIILLDESKSDFEDMTLEKHAKLTLDALQTNLGGEKEEVSFEHLTINGMPAVQAIVHGSSDGIKVVFIHTTIETKTTFCQALAWTLSSRWDQNKSELQQVVRSLREVSPAATRTP